MNIYPSNAPIIDVVQTFGADPTGTIDSAGAIQNALNVAPQLAGTGIALWLRPGQYNCLSGLLVRGTTLLRGAGTNLTQFYVPSITGALIKSGNTGVIISHSHFEGFSINGGNSNTLTAGIDATGFNNLTLDDIQVLNILTANATAFLANGGVAVAPNLHLTRLAATGITNGFGFSFTSVNGIQASDIIAQFNKESILLNSVTESNFSNILSSDNANTGDAGTLKLNNCNRTNIANLVTDDSSWIAVFNNGSTNCQFANLYLCDNNQALQVANGGLLYLSGSKHCSYTNINVEFTYATPVAGSNALTLDNVSGGQNSDNTFRSIHLHGNGLANTKSIHWNGTGLRNDFDALEIQGFAASEAPNETFNPGRFISLGGITTRARGTATIAATGTSIVVNHGLVTTPTWVRVTPTTDAGTAIRYWVDTLTATQFTIHCAGATTNALTFEWAAGVGDGP